MNDYNNYFNYKPGDKLRILPPLNKSNVTICNWLTPLEYLRYHKNLKTELTFHIPIKVEGGGYLDKFLTVKENSELYNKLTLNKTTLLPKEITILNNFNNMKQQTQTITRDNLKKIHAVACSGWKTKLEDYAKRNVFGNEITLEQSEIDEMFNASDNAQKKVLNQFFTKPLSIIDRIKSFKDACEVLGISENSIPVRDRILIIIKALNEGWFPNWTNHNEYKYWNYFQYNNNGVFSFSGRYITTSACVPSALYFKNRDLAAHAVKIGLKEYQDHYEFQY